MLRRPKSPAVVRRFYPNLIIEIGQEPTRVVKGTCTENWTDFL